MSSLEHYGIKGMRWGVRRTPEQLGHKNLRNAKTANFEKWGKSPDTNCLYIAGYSGSGKSTAAQSIARKNDQVIHLDLYSDEVSSGAGFQNVAFNKHLDRTVPNWREIAKEDSTEFKRFSKEYWKTVDRFALEIENFSKSQFKKGNRVIVEGIQVADGWLNQNANYYSAKPLAVLSTSKTNALMRAFERDERTDVANAVKSLFMKEGSQWSKAMDAKLDTLVDITNAKRNQKAVEDYLKKYGQRKVS